MGQVSITVNGRDYKIACDDGEEEHLAYLASYISHHADDLVGSAGQVGEARLLLMTALVLADELSTAFSELDPCGRAASIPENSFRFRPPRACASSLSGRTAGLPLSSCTVTEGMIRQMPFKLSLK